MEKEQNNGSVHNSATGNDVADDQAVAADISARDEYNPNWSKQQKKTPSVYTGGSVRAFKSTNAHNTLQIALHDVIQETVQNVIQETVQNAVQQTVQDALDNYDFNSIVGEVVDNHNFDDVARIVGEVVDNYNFDDIISDALDNHDFESVVGEIVENYDFGNSALFSIVVGDVMEDRFGELFRQHVKRLYINCER